MGKNFPHPKVPAGDLKKELLYQLATIPALVQQLQFTVKNPTVGKAATFTKVDSVIRETKSLMEAVNRVVEATLSCRQHVSIDKGPLFTHKSHNIFPQILFSSLLSNSNTSPPRPPVSVQDQN